MERTRIKTVELGATGVDITRVGYGAWAIGGGRYDWGWGTQRDDDSLAAIHHALELGVNWIDTAAEYGFGHSEAVVRRALAGLPERPYVFTKGGQPEGPGRTTTQDLRRDPLRRELEQSLTRLGLDAVDLYQIHWPIPAEEIEAGRRWSSSVTKASSGTSASRTSASSSFAASGILPPSRRSQPPYSLIARSVEDEILSFAERERIGVIVYSPMGSGLLTRGDDPRADRGLAGDDWRKHDPRFSEPQLSRILALVERLKTVADRHDTSPGAVAVAWALRNPAVDGAIVGFRRPNQADPILVPASLELTDEDIDTIEGRTS